MEIIKRLTERIHEEIEDMEGYAKFAIEVKETYPMLAHTLYSIALQEEEHQAKIHEQVVKIIEQYRRDHGAPPPEMMAVYNFLHGKAIEELAEARRYIEIYKSQ